MATLNLNPTLCHCLEHASQDILDRMTGRINKIIRERTRLNDLLQEASITAGLELINLQSTLSSVIDFETSLQTRSLQGFYFPPEGNIGLGEFVRCINSQISINLGNILGGFNALASAFCILNQTANLLSSLVDELLPKLDAQLSFGCGTSTVSSLQASMSSILGSVGASTNGTIDISSITAESLVYIGQDYYDAFNGIVRCCINIDSIKNSMKSLITDPFSGGAFNIVSFSRSLG